MDDYIQISKLNDFIFCPYSIYLHSVYENFDESVYHSIPQKRGKIRHETIDTKKYSTSKDFLQGMAVYSDKYRIAGKIDLYDKKNSILIERKYKLKRLFDGHIYQLYGEYFCLIEMGYKVKKLLIHSLSDNKRIEIKIPSKDETEKFSNMVEEMRKFDLEKWDEMKDSITKEKCSNCIYNTICSYSKC